jgi:hypothetical protein
MQLFAPDLIAEGRELSLGVTGIGLCVGLALWVFGWLGHRFWIVLGTTLGAGLVGLCSGRAFGLQPMAAGLLLAVAAGVLALALARLLAFAAGGVAAWAAVHAIIPSYEEPLVCFLAGGLLGVFLFRAWMIALTSFTGSVLMGYSGLCLADRLGQLDATTLTEQRYVLLNGACAGMTLAGCVVQWLIECQRRKLRYKKEDEEELHRMAEELERRKSRWFGWRRRIYRRVA